ncbi:hypothetical protein Peur_011214 [Populus x canadensis]
MKSLVVVPNDATENIIFSSFVEGERNGGVLGDEIVNLVLKFGEHRAWDLLNELIKLGTVLESDTCNALLTGFARQDNFNRMNGLMAKMVEMDIQPNLARTSTNPTGPEVNDHVSLQWPSYEQP